MAEKQLAYGYDMKKLRHCHPMYTRNLHSCINADDLQVYRYASCAASDQQTATDRFLACVGEIDQRMCSNRPKLNADKTEFTWFRVIIDDELTMEPHVANVVHVEQFLQAPSAAHCSAVIDLGHSADIGHCVHCESP